MKKMNLVSFHLFVESIGYLVVMLTEHIEVLAQM